MTLTNETKIQFCNAYNAMERHVGNGCTACWEYLRNGDGDLCDKGKRIIMQELNGTWQNRGASSN